MAERDLVVIGASAGGVEALRDLVHLLPEDLAATVLVVLHVPATGPSALPRILDRASPLEVKTAEAGEPLRHGSVLVAPPDHHLVVDGDEVRVTRGPQENGHRPAVDVLFRSAAASLGARVIAVVLSGALDDGAAGMVAVKLRGGVGVVQDPHEALHSSMPRAAAEAAPVDHVLPVAEIAQLLTRLVGETVPDLEPLSTLMRTETAMAELRPATMDDPDRPGIPAGLGCPDCYGSLFEIQEGGLLRYRCRVGHAWSPDGLIAAQSITYEGALWVALRALEEKAALSLDLSRRAAERGHTLSSDQFGKQAEQSHVAAAAIRRLIEGSGEGAHGTHLEASDASS